MNLFDIPESVLFQSFALLEVEDLLHFTQTCRAAKQRIYCDEALWRDRCGLFGVHSLEGWGVTSYRQLYLGLLHPVRNLIGLWFTPDAACGSLLYVSLRCPFVVGCAVLCPDLTGPAWLRPVFQISCRQDKQPHLSVQCLGAGLHGKRQQGHPAQLSYLNESPLPKLVLRCNSGCNHAELDFMLRLSNPLPQAHQQQAHPQQGSTPQEQTRSSIEPSEAQHQQQTQQPDRRSLLASWLLMQRHSSAVLDGLALNCRPVCPAQRYQRVPTQTREHILEGVWRGLYGAYAIEFIQVHVLDGKLSALKLTGDLSVPAGQLSFEVDVSHNIAHSSSTFVLPKSFRSADLPAGAPVELKVKEQYFGQGQIAQVGYLWPSWTPVQLFVFSQDNFGLLWESLQSFTMFTRLPERF